MNKTLQFFIIALVIISGLYLYISSNSEVEEVEVEMEPSLLIVSELDGVDLRFQKTRPDYNFNSMGVYGQAAKLL